MNVPRGLVLGWYHRMNAGDDRLCTSITHWLRDHRLTFMSHTEPPSQSVLAQHDYVLLGGGSIANEVAGCFRSMEHWVRPGCIPVFGIGLGVSQHDEFESEFRSIIDSGGRIWVRDAASKKNTMQDEQFVDVAPDLSWRLPLREYAFDRSGVAVNLRPGGGPRTLDVQQWKDVLCSIPNARSWPLCFGKDDDRPMLQSLYGDCDLMEEFDPTVPSQVSCVVAMRFHAIIFAIQTGTPFVAITHTRKLEYLLEDLGLSFAAVPFDRPDLFEETFQRVRENLEPSLLREKSRALNQRALDYSETLKKSIEESVTRNRRRRNLGFRVRSRVHQFVSRVLQR